MRIGIFSAAVLVPFLAFGQPRWGVRMNGLPARGGFNTVSIVDSVNVWIAGGSIWKSSNAGNQWAPVADLPSGESASVIAGTSLRDAVCATQQGKIFRTTNGGGTWLKVFDDTTVTDFFNDFEMFDNFTGYAIGDPPHVSPSKPPGFVRTTDGGQTWTVVNTNLPLGDSQYHGRTDFINPEVGWTYVWNDGVYKTTDGGKIWSRMSSLSHFSTLSFLNDSVGFYTWGGYPSEAGVSKTTDGGVTWRKTLSGSQIVFVRWAPGGKRFWAGGDSLYLSTDTGETWQKQFSAQSMGACNLLWGASFLTDDIGLISGECIVLGLVSDPAVSVLSQEQVSTSFDLKQNYPNPFNPSTTIAFSLSHSGYVTLKVSNLLGAEVATVLVGNLTAGSHSVGWNAANFPSGVYFYRLQTGESIQTKKLLLLK
jgi:photosystem II stability/assembly factor-like uncharacterized protein